MKIFHQWQRYFVAYLKHFLFLLTLAKFVGDFQKEVELFDSFFEKQCS